MAIFDGGFKTPTIISNNPDGTGNLATFQGHNTCRINGNTGQECTMNMQIPSDFNSVIEAFIVLAPAAAGDINFLLSTAFGTEGESPSIHNFAQGLTLLAIPAIQLTRIDISGLLTGISGEDSLGVTILDGNVVGSKNMHVFCSVIKYNR